jgi:hypothetical protein
MGFFFGRGGEREVNLTQFERAGWHARSGELAVAVLRRRRRGGIVKILFCRFCAALAVLQPTMIQ